MSNTIPEKIKLEELDYTRLDDAELDKVLSECTITGAEPVNFLVDGLILYLDHKGQPLVLDIDIDLEKGLILHIALA